MTLLCPSPTTFPFPNNLVPICASTTSLQLSVRKNMQPRLICVPRRHFILPYQQGKFTVLPRALRGLFTNTAPASLNGTLHALTQSLQNRGKSVQKLPLSLRSGGSGPASRACRCCGALPCSQNRIRLRHTMANRYGFGTTTINGFEHHWENRLGNKIKTGQPSRYTGHWLFLEEVSEAN